MPIGAPGEGTSARARRSTTRAGVRTWMAGVGLADNIRGKGADCRDTDVVCGLLDEIGHGCGLVVRGGGG